MIHARTGHNAPLADRDTSITSASAKSFCSYLSIDQAVVETAYRAIFDRANIDSVEIAPRTAARLGSSAYRSTIDRIRGLPESQPRTIRASHPPFTSTWTFPRNILVSGSRSQQDCLPLIV